MKKNPEADKGPAEAATSNRAGAATSPKLNNSNAIEQHGWLEFNLRRSLPPVAHLAWPARPCRKKAGMEGGA